MPREICKMLPEALYYPSTDFLIIRQPIFRTKGIILEHLFLISPPPKFLKFLENWKANPTLNSSIPISVAWGSWGVLVAAEGPLI
jgi:hypothetical protein